MLMAWFISICLIFISQFVSVAQNSLSSTLIDTAVCDTFYIKLYESCVKFNISIIVLFLPFLLLKLCPDISHFLTSIALLLVLHRNMGDVDSDLCLNATRPSNPLANTVGLALKKLCSLYMQWSIIQL